MMAVATAACSNSIYVDEEPQEIEEPKEIDEVVDRTMFCSYVNTENIGKTIPILNEILSELSAELDYKNKLQELVAWLKSQSCINDASVLFWSNVDLRHDRPMFNPNQPTSEVEFTFFENEILQTIILEITSDGPNDLFLKVEGYYENIYSLELCTDFMDVNNPENSIQIINEFLSGLPDYFTNQRKISALERWLNMQPCVFNAHIEHFSAVKTNPPSGEIRILFNVERDENGYYIGIPEVIIGVKWTNPMTITGFHGRHYKHENVEKPTLVPSTEYHYWIDQTYGENFYFYLNLGSGHIGRLIVINSNCEFAKYIPFMDNSGYQAIDFTKHTLLLAFGATPNSITYYTSYLHRYSSGYVLNIEYSEGFTFGMHYWRTAIVTDKLEEDSVIEILINRRTFNR